MCEASFVGNRSMFGSAGEFVENLQHLVGIEAYAEVISQIAPPDYPACVKQELGRACDISAVDSAVRVQKVEMPNHSRPRVGEKRVRIARLLAKITGYLGWVHADGHDAHAARREFIEILLETP